MLEFDAVYFDGKSSAPNKVSGQYNQTANKIQFHLNKELFSWDITNCSLEKLINQLTITNNSSFEQIVITKKEAIGIISKKNSNSFSSLYNGLIGAGIKVHLLIIAFILSCIIFANFYVLPNVAEKCVFLIPTSYDNQIGESFYNQFIDYQDIDSSKTVILNKFNSILNVKDVNTKITVVNAPEINAFALPSGHIIIYTGIIDVMDSYQELAALIGHETAHVANRHSIKMMCRNLSTYLFISAVLSDINGIMSIIAENINQLQSLSYSRSIEHEADVYGLNLLVEQKINPNGMTDLFESLQSDASIYMPEFLSSHPVTDDRILFANEFSANNKGPYEINPALKSLFNKLKTE